MEPGDVVLCAVKKIETTSIFVDIEQGGEGSIVVSEIAPGRIRNMREYVVLNKKIVCKVLKVENNHVHLSLRRVTSKEKQDLLKKYDIDKALTASLKSILQEKALPIIQVIKKELGGLGLADFFLEAKQNQELFKKYLSKEEIEKIQPLLKEKEKEVEIKKDLILKCPQINGIKLIKSILDFSTPGLDITYIAASRFVVKLKAPNYREGNATIHQVISEIESRAKKAHAELQILEK